MAPFPPTKGSPILSSMRSTSSVKDFRRRICLIAAVIVVSMLFLLSHVDRNHEDSAVEQAASLVKTPGVPLGTYEAIDEEPKEQQHQQEVQQEEQKHEEEGKSRQQEQYQSHSEQGSKKEKEKEKEEQDEEDEPVLPEDSFPERDKELQKQKEKQEAEDDDRPFWDFFTEPALYGGYLNVTNTTAKRGNNAPALMNDPRQTSSKPATTPVAKVYNPYPDYTSTEWKSKWRGEYQPCVGARGIEVDSSIDDMVLAYDGVPEDYPSPSLGSYDAVGLDGSVCFDRYGRLGAYGYGEGEKPGRTKGWHKPQAVNWNDTNWGQLQKQCVERNKERFDFTPRESDYHVTPERNIEVVTTTKTASQPTPTPGSITAKPRKRTAVLIRTWTGYEYSKNVMQQIRSMITELSLQTGGEYEVFLMVHVKDNALPIYSDPVLYKTVIRKFVPKEFWDITILWNESMNKVWYPLLELESEVYISQWMPLQRFSHDHPEFDYYWNYEIDTRYLGHHFHFTDTVDAFARAQPRKGLWERNERFYIPSAHGPYASQFRSFVESQASHHVWGPAKVQGVTPLGPTPPSFFPDGDAFEWGVGEDADLVTLLPLFDPIETNWVFRDWLWGYHEQTSTTRRTTIICQFRISKRLLDLMHAENLSGHHMTAEMWPLSASLHHGLKAVYAPHPIFLDRDWPDDALTQIFNPGPRGESGSGALSVFGWGREMAMEGFTWYYNALLPAKLYKNWLGWRDGSRGGEKWEAEHGRMCAPAMWLHPIKEVRDQ